MTYLHHLTLNTGHSRRSYRREVGDDALAHTADLLASAIEAGGDADMPIPGYRLHVEPYGSRRAMICTVSRADQPLVSFGVAARPTPALWTDLTALCARVWPDIVVPAQPDAPWCAVVLLPALSLDRDASAWVGDFERCAAWGWLQ